MTSTTPSGARRSCSSVTVLDYGRVIARGDGKTIRNNPKVIAAYLGGDD